MTIFSLLALSFGMSMDAFASAIAKGATQRQTSFSQAFRAGIVFGVIEGIAPIIGWFFGGVARGWLSQIDHWIAFVLLLFLAIRFIREAMVNQDSQNDEVGHQTNPKDNFALMILTAVATSIDSLVVGVSLAFLAVNIYMASLLIGVATTIMATLGLYLGNRLGLRFGKIAMFIGGLVLFVIGASILYSHLTH